MSSVVQVGRLEIQSSSESAEEMVKALTPEKPEGRTPKPIKDRGQDVPDKPAAISTSEAGKKGAEAAAKAREEKAKQESKPEAKPDKPVDTDEGKAEAKSKEDKAEVVDKPEDKQETKDDSRTSAQARIRELARERAELRRQAEEARAEAEQARQELERVRRGGAPAERQPQRQAAAPDDDPEPSLDNFETWDEYNKAQAAHAARQEFKRLEQQRNLQARQEAMARYHQEQQERFATKVKAAQDADPTIMERIDPELMDLLYTTPPGQPATPGSTIADEVFESEHPAEILAYFTEHPEEVQRLAKMPNARAIARAVGLLEARFAAGGSPTPPAEPEPKYTPAPPPLQTVSTSAQPGNVESDLTRDMSYDEYHRKRKRWK